MRVNIYCCLLACALGCHVSADLFHKVVEERQVVILHCRQPVKNKVTWSRERDGRKVDILTIDGDRDIKHIKDPKKRFISLADKSLVVFKADISDSGKYLCDDEEAVELTVIPLGTRIHSVTERTSFSLNCPHDVGGSHDPGWRREMAGKEKPIRSDVSTESRSLIFTEVGPGDSGLYYCDGKPAGYLNVTTQKKPDGGGKAGQIQNQKRPSAERGTDP
ncbi:uncharacterized protein LOC125019527 isoform X3 [Mugil cephalus]|uniref:uncharacterized protein LOC125019527 isoform X3 n=1 Tax=Mugil cephalus TaxID=48193 RepID=UPI001FB64A11|nr:uncharacterized protein LOC125019527 isoform X3 [Mugil cephalus]